MAEQDAQEQPELDDWAAAIFDEIAVDVVRQDHAEAVIREALGKSFRLGARERDQLAQEHARLKAATEPERELRARLWVNHGCPFPVLYGDDGEMQCNASTCRIDFKRTPLPRLLDTLFALGRLHCGKLPEAKHAETGQEMHSAHRTEPRLVYCQNCRQAVPEIIGLSGRSKCQWCKSNRVLPV